MSEIQTHIGKLVRLSIPSLACFEKWLSKKGYDLSVCKDEYPNYKIYNYNGDPKYIYFNNEFIYEVLDNSIDTEDINYFVQINKDHYEYVFQYYDGGTCFQEQLSEHLQEVNDDVNIYKKLEV